MVSNSAAGSRHYWVRLAIGGITEECGISVIKCDVLETQFGGSYMVGLCVRVGSQLSSYDSVIKTQVKCEGSTKPAFFP